MQTTNISNSLSSIDVITNPDLFKIICEVMPGFSKIEQDIINNSSLEEIIQTSNLEILKLLFKTKNKHEYYKDSWYYSIQYDCLEIIQFLHENNIDGYRPYLLDMTIEFDSIKAAKFLMEHAYEFQEFDADAFYKGKLEFIKILHDNEYEFESWDMELAAGNGHIDVIQYLHDVGYRGENRVIEEAARNGYLSLVKYLHNQGYTCSDDETIRKVAANGNLEMVQWLYNHNCRGSNSAIESAARYCHLDIVKWLHDRGYDTTIATLQYAIMENHKSIVIWLLSNCQYTNNDLSQLDDKEQKYLNKITEQLNSEK